MKNQLTIGALFFGAILFVNTSVKAQTANMTITLSDVISVDPASTAGKTSGDVAFAYPTEASYRLDQNINRPNHLIITSTKAFDVKVQALGAEFVGSGTANGAAIPIGVMTIKVNATSDVGGTPADVILDGSLQTLITSAPLGSVKKVDIDYFIPKEKSSSTDILGKPAGAYAQQVTYTVTAH